MVKIEDALKIIFFGAFCLCARFYFGWDKISPGGAFNWMRLPLFRIKSASDYLGVGYHSSSLPSYMKRPRGDLVFSPYLPARKDLPETIASDSKYNTRMATVRFPNVMKFYVGNRSEFSVHASSVAELMERIIEQYPDVKIHLVDSDGSLRRYFNIFVNGTHIRDLEGLETALKDEDKVILMASAAGG